MAEIPNGPKARRFEPSHFGHWDLFRIQGLELRISPLGIYLGFRV